MCREEFCGKYIIGFLPVLDTAARRHSSSKTLFCYSFQRKVLKQLITIDRPMNFFLSWEVISFDSKPFNEFLRQKDEFCKGFKANTEVGFLRELLESDRQQMLSCSGFKMTKTILSCTTSCVAKIFCVHDSSNEAFSSLFVNSFKS